MTTYLVKYLAMRHLQNLAALLFDSEIIEHRLLVIKRFDRWNNGGYLEAIVKSIIIWLFRSRPNLKSAKYN